MFSIGIAPAHPFLMSEQSPRIIKLRQSVYAQSNIQPLRQTEIYSDGEEFGVQEGSLIRVEPEAERAIAAGDKGMTYICIQAAKGSLKQYTMTDGRLGDSKASWM